jgi:RNase P subunit RPR2
MVKKLSKAQTLELIEAFFSPENINNRTPKEVKKIKRLAMKHNIALKEKRKLFCKKCLSPHKDSSVRIKDGYITITCGECRYKNRWKIK